MQRLQNLDKLSIFLTISVPYCSIKFADSSKFCSKSNKVSLIYLCFPDNIHKEVDHILCLFYNNNTLQEYIHRNHISSWLYHIYIRNIYRNQPSCINNSNHIFHVCKVIKVVNNYLAYFLLFINQMSFI